VTDCCVNVTALSHNFYPQEAAGSLMFIRCLREYRFTRGSPDQSIIGLFLFVL
jgi:hypothetical protein